MGVFVLSDGQGLVALTPSEFVREGDFQELLEKYPVLLSGSQFETASVRRWHLIKREKAIPAENSGSDRWSVDHLFVDQSGIPTLVEVKRQSDTRLRREVIAQRRLRARRLQGIPAQLPLLGRRMLGCAAPQRRHRHAQGGMPAHWNSIEGIPRRWQSRGQPHEAPGRLAGSASVR